MGHRDPFWKCGQGRTWTLTLGVSVYWEGQDMKTMTEMPGGEMTDTAGTDDSPCNQRKEDSVPDEKLRPALGDTQHPSEDPAASWLLLALLLVSSSLFVSS